MSRRTAVVTLTLALALSPGALLAQDTREAVLAEQRAEKARSLENAYGIGFRFNSSKAVWYRVDLGLGGEGVHLFFKFSKAF